MDFFTSWIWKHTQTHSLRNQRSTPGTRYIVYANHDPVASSIIIKSRCLKTKQQQQQHRWQQQPIEFSVCRSVTFNLFFSHLQFENNKIVCCTILIYLKKNMPCVLPNRSYNTLSPFHPGFFLWSCFFSSLL